MSFGETGVLTDKRAKISSARILIFLLIIILIFSLLYGVLTAKNTIKKNIVIISLIAFFAFSVYRLDIFYFLMIFLMIILFLPFSYQSLGIMGYTLRGLRIEYTLPLWPILLFLFIGDSALHKRLKIYRTPSDKWILFYLIAFTLSFIYSLFAVSNHWINVLRDGFRYSRLIFLMYIIVSVIDSRDKLERFNNFIFLLAAFFGIYGIIEFFFFPHKTFQGDVIFLKTRIETLFGYTTLYSCYLNATIPFVFAFAVYVKKKFKKSILWGLFILLYINMILTFSRGSFLAVNLTILIMALLIWGKKALLLWVALIGFIALVGTTTPILKRQMTLFTNPVVYLQMADLPRIYEYAHLIEGIKEKPLFGAGLGSVTVRYAILKNRGQFSHSYRPLKELYAHHSLVLDIAGRMGIFALIAISGVFITLFKALYKAYRLAGDEYLKANVFGSVGALIAYSMYQFIDNLIDSNVFIYFIFIVSVGIVAWRYVHNLED